jgi:hypothetical protein
MNTIWPERVVSLPRVGHRDGEPWLGDDKVEQILDVVTTGGRPDVLDKPVILDGDTVRLIALVLLGNDALGGRRALYLRVTNERFYEVGPVIKLTIVSYDPVGGSDRRSIRPGQAGDILDGFVQQLQAVPGFAPVVREKPW